MTPHRHFRSGAALVSFLVLVFAGAADALPDLRPEIMDAVEVFEDPPDAEVAEGCAGGSTDRRLVRFALLTHNDGPDEWNLGAPGCPDCATNPGAACTNPLFVCGLGHARPLVASFARPELVDQGGNVVAQGYKPGFCLLDSSCSGGGTPQFGGCNPMGISAGCADRYSSGFKCMYVDFTDDALPAGDYILRLTSDPENRVAEADETNNVAEVPVTIGPPPEPCGNGILDVGELCDDGDTSDGDGCSASCQVEACYTCSGAPSTCIFDGRCARCRRTVSKEATKLAQARAKILSSCELGRIKGRHDDPCPDPTGSGAARRAADKIAKADSKFASKVARTCGGDDRVCGGDLTGEVPPWLMRFPAACPGVIGGTDPSCTQTINDCGDLAGCVECLQRTAVDQTMTLIFGDLLPTDPRDQRARNRCQRTIGTETHRLFGTQLAERAKCWDARRKGKHGDDCPDAAASFASAAFKAATKIVNAVSRHEQKLCKSCGGSDGLCGAAPDDLDAQSEIGAPATCDDVTIPGGASCAGTVATLQDLVDCGACVSEYHASCVQAALAPEYVAYPAECSPAGP